MNTKEITVLMVEPDKTDGEGARSLQQRFLGIWSSGGRQKPNRHLSLLVDGSQVGGREKPSSPASRTKETVERLSLFFVVGDGFSVPFVAKTAKTP